VSAHEVDVKWRLACLHAQWSNDDQRGVAAEPYNERVACEGMRELIRQARRGACSAMLVVGAISCSRSTPTVPTPPPPPPVVNNTPPVIQSVTAGAARIEAGLELEITASVQDEESAPDQLTYTWSAQPTSGTFVGTGPQVRWRAPVGAATPDTYTLTLTVSEKYVSGGVQRENSVSSSVQVRYNDPVAEISGITSQFLTDFGTYSVSPEQCVRNFSDSCPGKAEELEDIRNNRRLFQILSATFTISSIVFYSDRTRADITAPCTFVDIEKATGRRETVTGTCKLKAVYEGFRWFLCESRFEWSGTTYGLNLRYSVP
jgi:hypothetical protein